MPGMLTLLHSDINVPAVKIPLWLRSDLLPPLRLEPHCIKKLASKEEQLHVAQCKDVLDMVRSLQRGRGALVHRQNRQLHGQYENGKAQLTMKSMQQKCLVAREQYEKARHAVLGLRGVGKWQNELRELREDDLTTPDGTGIFDNVSTGKKLMKRPKTGKQAEGQRKVLWIWTVAGVIVDDGDVTVHEWGYIKCWQVQVEHSAFCTPHLDCTFLSPLWWKGSQS